LHKISVKVETPKTYAGAMLAFGCIFVLFGMGFETLTANQTLYNLGTTLIVMSVLVWSFDLVYRRTKRR